MALNDFSKGLKMLDHPTVSMHLLHIEHEGRVGGVMDQGIHLFLKLQNFALGEPGA